MVRVFELAQANEAMAAALAGEGLKTIIRP